MFKHIYPAVAATLLFALLTGIVFPLTITAIASVCFPFQAHGSLITSSGANADSKVIGSALIGQSFSSPRYFHGRPSAAGSGYNAVLSGGTNLGPTSDKLINGSKDFSGIKTLARLYRQENNLSETTLLPVDAVTRSGSGLDSDISPENAQLQAARVATARKINPATIDALLAAKTEQKLLGFLGERRINVLKLNLALDKISSENSEKEKATLVHK
ncbi:MAG: K(+)-transporting ATPase subunit C [Cyanobacteria bacterium REEB67]|nr:K(+)-transporting ATPase subunit C [Cyanobacteria bacterium REEB67]